MDREKIKQRIKFSVVIIVISIMIAFAIFTVLRYEVEGEKNMPFELGKIIVVSSAVTTDSIDESTNQNIVNEGNNTENTEDKENVNENTEEHQNDVNEQQLTKDENYIWQEKVVQTNDVYIYIDKNSDFKDEEIIKSIRIENIQILQNVKLGKIQVYMPNSLDDGLYKYTNEFLVNSTLTYKGGNADNKKNLEIGNQGGCVCISFANIGLGEYKSNDDTQIEQGAYILEKMNILNEDLKFKVSFDLIIEVQDKAYKTNLELDLPIEEVVGKKETHMEITNFDNVIFKRF